MRPNDWDGSLRLGNEWEEKLRMKVASIIQVQSVKRVAYAENLDLQRKGIDLVLNTKAPMIEVKTRKFTSYKYRDILLETVSVLEKDVLGWFYTTQADIVTYSWLNQSSTNLIDGYLIFISSSLREWLENNKHRFKTRKTASLDSKTGECWTTLNKAVPIRVFPKSSLMRFNPELDFTKQSTLGCPSQNFHGDEK